MSNISQDGREQDGPEQHGRSASALLVGNTMVYVEYTPSGFQWGKSLLSMVPLSTTITTSSPSSITYEFVQTGSTAIWYKLPPTTPNGTSLPTSNGPTTVVASGTRNPIAFSTSSGGTYYTGYVKVSGDGFGDLVSGGSEDEDEDEG
jgi:hypothetical protein